jgi:hypothetical protein
MLWIFSPEKSDGFGRDRTRDLESEVTEGLFDVAQVAVLCICSEIWGSG